MDTGYYGSLTELDTGDVELDHTVVAFRAGSLAWE